MTASPDAQAALALHRFGMGPRPGSIRAIAGDPRGALLAELDAPGAGQISAAGLPSATQAFRAVAEFNAERQAKQKLEARRKAGSSPPAMEAPAEQPGAAGPAMPQQLLLNEIKARIDAAAGATIGFAERLVWFWSNHFCVSADKVQSMAGPYEREAIRPFVTGRFADMLLAAESHPAMLIYLDNSASIGPNSVAGVNRDRGIDENLAREILELHTLGARGGYTQEDVTKFAFALTGWTNAPALGESDHGGEFAYVPRMHEPGAKTILGRAYADTGAGQGRAILADLARHPATASHVATKLAAHFVADRPPPSLVEKLAKVFAETDGDLGQVARALVQAPEAWSDERVKLKRPSEWIVSALRITGARPPVQRLAGAHATLGEPAWRPASPKGFADEAGGWIDGLGERLNIASAWAETNAARLDPRALVDAALGPLASAGTREAIGRAESKQQALALLLMAPEFLRR